MADTLSLTGLSIVIPAYNEEQGIEATLDRAHAAALAGGVPFEIIVVDDGSTDRTPAIAATRARVVRHPHNLGYGRSLKDGISAASHDVIVIVDADRTYPIEDLPRLLRPLSEGFDMVVGARSGEHYRGVGVKGPLRGVLTFLVEFTTGRAVPDVNSGFRVFSRSIVMKYFNQLCDTFSFTTSLTLAYMMTGRFVTYVPISYDARTGHTKVRLFRDGLRTLQYIVQAILYYNPIKIFLLLAAAALGVTILGALAAAVFGPLLLFVTAGILGAIGIFALGLLADLLRQIMTK
jgi:glycosyltransferase involved in cell wall biosynthesis